MALPILYGVNRLEAGTVTVGSTVSGRPSSRLADRFIGPRWEGAGPIVWDMGTALPFDAVLGAPGHNLTGATLTVQTDDNAGFASPTTLGSITATAAAFRIPCTGTVERYGRLSISGGPGTVELAELFASVGFTVPRSPLYATSQDPNYLGKYVGHETETGVWMATVIAAPQWDAVWEVPDFSVSQRDAFIAFYQAIAGGARPFFLVDPESVTRFVRWLNPTTTLSLMLPDKYQAHWQFREVSG